MKGDGYLYKGADRLYLEGQLLPDAESMRIIAGGKVIPQEALFDIKTHSMRKKDDDVHGGNQDVIAERGASPGQCIFDDPARSVLSQVGADFEAADLQRATLTESRSEEEIEGREGEMHAVLLACCP
jgi:hypothetical protein